MPTPESTARLSLLETRLREATLAVVWRQWRALGAMATGDSTRVGTMVDPEALLLVSLALLPHATRLQDLLSDWIAVNSDLISVQRLKNLHEQYPAGVRERLGMALSALAHHAQSTAKDTRWKSLVQSGAHEWFSRTAKSRAIRTRLTDPATLVLRLRLAFSVGVKADVLAYLIGGDGARFTAREIAEATGYTTAASRRAADDLAESRFIEVSEGQPAQYRVRPEQWAMLLGLSTPNVRWRGWQDLFVFGAALSQRASEVAPRPISDYAFGVMGRVLMESHRRAFTHDGIAEWSVHSAIPDWGDFFEASVERLARAMEMEGD